MAWRRRRDTKVSPEVKERALKLLADETSVEATLSSIKVLADSISEQAELLLQHAQEDHDE